MTQIHHSLTVYNEGQEVDTFDLSVDVSFEGGGIYYDAVRGQDTGAPYPDPLKRALTSMLNTDDEWRGKVAAARDEWRCGQYNNQMCDAKGE